MSDSKWSSKTWGSWFPDYEPTNSGISIEGVEVISAGEILVVVALPQGSVDPEGGSSAIPEEELPRDPEEESLGDPRETFFPSLSSQ